MGGSYLTDNNKLALQPARLAACRLATTRLSFCPDTTDTKLAGTAGDLDFYTHHEVRLPDQNHTVVTDL